jgi:chromosome segregation ATPase
LPPSDYPSPSKIKQLMDLDPLKKELFEECSRLEQRKRILSDEVQTLENDKKLSEKSVDKYKDLISTLEKREHALKTELSQLNGDKVRLLTQNKTSRKLLKKLKKDQDKISQQITADLSDSQRKKDHIEKSKSKFLKNLQEKEINLNQQQEDIDIQLKGIEEREALLKLDKDFIEKTRNKIAENEKELKEAMDSAHNLQIELINKTALKRQLVKKRAEVLKQTQDELDKQKKLTAILKRKHTIWDQKLEAVKKDKQENKKGRERIGKDRQNLISQQISLRNAYYEARRKGVI